MKKFTKLLGIVLIIALVMSMGTMAWADETTYGDTDGNNSGTAAANKGKVTVANAINGMTYDIYQILTLESFDDANSAFSYKATSAWNAFINSDAIKGVFVTVNDDGYVQWITKKTVNGTETDKSAAELEAEAAAFAKLAIAYAEKNNIDNNGSATASNGTASFTNLPLGYYLVNSSAGALCSLDTTHLAVNIKEKNEVPTIEKKVGEDSKETEGIVYDDNDADIGQVITYQTVINAKPGAQGYKLYDKMTKGLTFIEITSITATTGTGEDATTVPLISGTDYTVATSGDYVIGIDNNNNYTPIVVTGSSNYANDDVTFLVTFAQTYLDTITADTAITVTYTAKLNENAVLNIPETTTLGNGNDNRTILEYGNKNFTTEDQTRTHTYDVGIFKYYVNGTTNTALANATFVMTKTEPGATYAVPTTNLMAFTEVTAHQKYRYDVSATTGTVTEITTDNTGKFTIEGLDEGTYYLYEKTAPDGYNILSKPIIITITSSTYSKTEYTSITSISRKAGTDATKLAEIGNVDSVTTDNEVGVLNQSGTVLPSTGGIGTTIFYVVGSILVVAAGVLLITKKRMSREG